MYLTSTGGSRASMLQAEEYKQKAAEIAAAQDKGAGAVAAHKVRGLFACAFICCHHCFQRCRSHNALCDRSISNAPTQIGAGRNVTYSPDL